MPGFPQSHLLGYAVFHSVSAFCNAGITIFPAGMEQVGVADSRAVQLVMILLVLVGTVGFGVYLEGITRLKNRIAGVRSARRWSTNSWLVIRVMVIVMLLGSLGLTLLSAFEPSTHQAHGSFNLWESVWNAVGRSAGFALSDIGDYGPVYQLFLAFLMFVGGNPAGTGGGVYAPVFALCLLEVYRVLQGKQDVELHNRRIARNTVERAMATVVLSIFWIVFTTLLLMLLEPGVAQQHQGVVRLLFMEVSAYTTTGYELGALPHISGISKLIITLNMLFGRVGMFTFMLIFIRQQEASPIRLPETRLPLN
jgi:Trk-type K+ transport system membrane component